MRSFYFYFLLFMETQFIFFCSWAGNDKLLEVVDEVAHGDDAVDVEGVEVVDNVDTVNLLLHHQLHALLQRRLGRARHRRPAGSPLVSRLLPHGSHTRA